MGNGSLGDLNIQEVGFGGARLPYSASSTDNLFLPPTSCLFFFFGCTGSSLSCVDSLLQHVRASL